MHRSAASRRNVEQVDYESHQRLVISVMIVRLAHLTTGLIGLSVRAVIILVLAPNVPLCAAAASVQGLSYSLLALCSCQ